MWGQSFYGVAPTVSLWEGLWQFRRGKHLINLPQDPIDGLTPEANMCLQEIWAYMEMIADDPTGPDVDQLWGLMLKLEQRLSECQKYV